MGLCQYVDLCFHALSLPCLHTFWHAIPTFLMFFKSCFCTFLMLISVTVEFEAMKTLSGWEAARCDEHPFRAKIKVRA